jgi:hypothetical protein
MLSKKLILFCDILLLGDGINETTFYDDINISDKKNHIAYQDLEHAEVTNMKMTKIQIPLRDIWTMQDLLMLAAGKVNLLMTTCLSFILYLSTIFS